MGSTRHSMGIGIAWVDVQFIEHHPVGFRTLGERQISNVLPSHSSEDRPQVRVVQLCIASNTTEYGFVRAEAFDVGSQIVEVDRSLQIPDSKHEICKSRGPCRVQISSKLIDLLQSAIHFEGPKVGGHNLGASNLIQNIQTTLVRLERRIDHIVDDHRHIEKVAEALSDYLGRYPFSSPCQHAFIFDDFPRSSQGKPTCENCETATKQSTKNATEEGAILPEIRGKKWAINGQPSRDHCREEQDSDDIAFMDVAGREHPSILRGQAHVVEAHP